MWPLTYSYLTRSCFTIQIMKASAINNLENKKNTAAWEELESAQKHNQFDKNTTIFIILK